MLGKRSYHDTRASWRNPMLYVGIDIAKASHVAAFLSASLLTRYKRFEACPTLAFDQSRAGFEKLFTVMTKYAPAQECSVLLESTGHYSRPLEEYLQERGITLYRVHVQEKVGRNKSDKLDAQALAALLYNQIERHMLVTDKSQEIHRLIPPNETVRLLRGLVQHRTELVRETTRRKNKLIAIADEMFPELVQIYKKPYTKSALALREKFPTPVQIAAASLTDLYTTRSRNRPSNAQFVQLQDLARQSIGTKDQSRITCLVVEQQQLIVELRLLDEHIEQLETVIEKAVAGSREGQILTSFKSIGAVHAAVLISQIGSIANFESAAKLRSYCGWSPHQAQTGVSKDSMTLDKGGNRLLKHTVTLIAYSAIRHDSNWKVLYDRLVPIKAIYDERTKKWKGKMKVVGRIAGQIINVVYTLLKRDHDLLASLPPGSIPPSPELYDASKHRIKR
jgi:transposase